VALQAAGIYLKLMNPAESVRSMLRLTGLQSVFEICEEQTFKAGFSIAEVAPLFA